MDDISVFLISVLPLLVLGVLAFFMLQRSRAAGRMVCTRCDGSGQVNEKWPDPSRPDGWHRLEGICPKCKGRGRV